MASRSLRCMTTYGAPYRARNGSPRSRAVSSSAVSALRSSSRRGRTPASSTRPSTPRPSSTRVALGASCNPAPSSANCAAFSSTRTWCPSRASARAAVSPPMPPPTTRMSARIARLPRSEGKPVLGSRGVVPRSQQSGRRYNGAVSYEAADRESAIHLAVQASRALAAGGQGDMVWGHVSVRDPGGRGAWMKSAGWGLEEIDAEKIVLVSPDGAVLDSGAGEGGGPRHIEYPIHTEIMAARPDVGSVVHTHSPAANQFAALDVPLRPLDHAGSLFCYPDIPRFTLTGGLIKTQELGAALAGTLGSALACLMPQHGIVAVGPDAPAAVMTAVLLDRACRTQLTAMAAGPLRRWGGEEDTVAKRADVWSSRQLRAGWEYLLRRAAQIG